jgi:endo-1,4-beta-xylanase
MTKNSRLIRIFSILAVLPFLLLGSAQAFARNSTSSSVYLPLVMNNYESWSTNFANVTDLAAAGIRANGASAAIDTTNVNSGGKSVKIYGTIGAKGSCLNLSFDFWGVAGRNSVDLSGMNLILDVYQPADSPINGLVIHVFSGGKFVIVRTAHSNLYKGQWQTYKVDIRENILLKTWRTYSYMTSPGLTDAQAVDILKNAETIAIVGVVYSEYTPAQSYFLLDRLGWESAGPAPAYNASIESLQEVAPASLPIGGLMEPDGVYDPEYMRHFVQEFNATQSWGVFPVTEPAGDVFTYDQSWSPMPYADYFNETQGFPLIRYTGIGENPNWIPDWLPGKTYAQTETILDDFTGALVGHYKGKTDIWILFNELLRYNLSFTPYTGLGLKDKSQFPQTWSDNYSPFSSSPSDLTMIEQAFRVARTADPDALLIINDSFNSTEGTVEGEAMYALAAKIKSDGTPIDGVGFEGHFTLDQSGNFHDGGPWEPSLAFDPVHGFTDIAANIERYAALGLKVAFTEVDVSIYVEDIDTSTLAGQALLAQREALQAAAYRSLLHIALTHPNVVFFNLWDWADYYSYTDPEWAWVPLAGFGNDLGLLDMSYQKKPSYYAMLDELKATQAPLPGIFNKIGPMDSATDQSTALALSWSASVGATGYDYCLDTSADNSCSTSWISTGNSTSVSVSLLPLTTYSWQVRARNDSGIIHADHATWKSFTTGSDWSTNFAVVTDPAAVGIFASGNGNSLVMDTTNVNSGGKSVKIHGIVGSTSSLFILNFNALGLLGHETFDLSTKTISYEIYLPPDSPLDFLFFKILTSSQEVTLLQVPVNSQKGAWTTFSVDIPEFIALESWTSSGLTHDEVVNILRNAEQIVLVGSFSVDHTPVESYFLIDRLGWVASVP